MFVACAEFFYLEVGMMLITWLQSCFDSPILDVEGAIKRGLELSYALGLFYTVFPPIQMVRKVLSPALSRHLFSKKIIWRAGLN